MRPTRLLFAALSMLVAGGSGCKPSLTIDAEEINITEKNLSFPGVISTVPGAQSASASFKIVTSKLGAAANPDSSAVDRMQRMEVTRIVLQTKTGIPDFSFLQKLKVSATNYNPSNSANVGKPVVSILECPNGTEDCPLVFDNTGKTTLEFPLDPPADLLPLWANTNLYIVVTAMGFVPQVDWSVDVTFSLSVRWST